MKKGALLNSSLSHVVACLGHNDALVIGDAGLPIPAGPERIDLALTRGIPSFLETLACVASEMQIEKVIVAEETGQVSPHVLAGIKKLLPHAKYEVVSHEALKKQSGTARAVVRTGEFTPYANVILVSGVVF